MRNRYSAFLIVLIALTLGLGAMASADDGREVSQPGTPISAEPTEDPTETGNDQDIGGVADIVHADDVIIDGSLSVGFDAYSGYNFGFDTLVFRENNLRILFEDTSSTASFPDNDWRILINQSDNGGQEYFAVQDASASRTVFKLKAGAPSNALVIDSQGDLGLGTGTPVSDIHAVNGNTPTLRLDQDGSAGWGTQVWDVAGNEANFFVRDVTHGSRLPFRIRPGANSNTMYLDTGNEVGFGTASPTSSIHVLGTDGVAQLKVEETNASASNRQLLVLANNGGAQFSFNNGTTDWRAGSDNSGKMRLDVLDGAGDIEFRLDTDGNLEIAGSMTENSDVNAKESIERLDPAAILASVLDLQVSEWSYIDQSARHIGPMAQDFAAAFGLGVKNTSIATRDIAGVALLAIQALAQENAELEARVSDLERRLAELEALIANG